MFNAESVTVRYPQSDRAAVADVSFRVQRGSFFAVIGPNGSGKSTLLRTLLGGIASVHGTITFDERRLEEWPRIELARRIGAVTQSEEMPFPLSVRALVAMGRYPHLGALRPERELDRQAIEHAMQRADVASLADRSIATLSGGERQRTRIARALAQSPDTLVLDEPTAALDIGHEMAVFELLRSLVREEARTVVVATHHINLAARYADTLLLLGEGRIAVLGAADDVMKKDVLETVYGWPVSVHRHEAPGFDHGAPQVSPLSRFPMEMT